MFDYPIIPIIVFITILIPPLVIAFFRGWKASLFIALITLVFIGIEVGVSFAIYDSLWGIFKSIFIKDLQPGLSPEALKDISKASVIILFIGICMLPTYGLVIGLYFPIRRLLKKHLFPKTNDINQNQKEIERSPHFVSRIAGVGVAGISSLFFASSAAAAASTLFTKNENRSGFNNFTSSIANLYTFGQGKHDRDFAIVLDFAKKELTTKYQDSLGKVFLLARDRDATVNAAFNSLSTGHFHDELKKIINNPRVFETIIKLILESNKLKGKQILLRDMDYQQLDEKGNKIGVSTSAYTTKELEDRLNTYSSSPNLNLHASDTSVKSILDYLRFNLFVDFEKTGFYLQWKNGNDLLQTLKQNVKTQQQKDVDLKSKFVLKRRMLDSIYASVRALEARLEVIGLDGSPFSYNTVVEFNQLKDHTVTKQISNANGELKQSSDRIVVLTQYRDSKETAYHSANHVLYGTNTGTNAQAGSSQFINNQNKQQMDDDKTKYDNAVSLRIQKDKDIADQKDLIRKTEDRIKELDKLIKDYPAQNQALISAKAILVSEKDAAQRLVNQYTAEISRLDGEISNLETIISTKQGIVADRDSKIQTTNAEISVLDKTINTAVQTLSTKNKQKTSLQSEIAKLNNDISDYASQIAALPSGSTAELTRLTNLKRGLEATLLNKQTTLASVTSDIKAAQQRKTDAEQQKATKANLVQTYLTDKQAAQALINTNTPKLNTLKRQRITARENKASQENIVASKTKAINLKATDISNLQSNFNNNNQEKSTKENALVGYKSSLTRLTSEQSQAVAAESAAKRNYDNSKSIYDAYKPTFDRNKQNQINAKNEFDTADRNLANENKHHSDLITERNTKKAELTKIAGASGTWKTTLEEMQRLNNEINRMEYRTEPTLLREQLSLGSAIKIPPVYKPKAAQTPAYYAWAFNTIPGAKDYLAKGTDDVKAFEKIKDAAKIEYERLLNEYLNTVKTLLKS